MIELAGWIAMALAVTGCWLNNRRMIACFVVWMVSNAISLWIHCDCAVWSLAVRDAVFFLLAIEGRRKWRSGLAAEDTEEEV